MSLLYFRTDLYGCIIYQNQLDNVYGSMAYVRDPYQ